MRGAARRQPAAGAQHPGFAADLAGHGAGGLRQFDRFLDAGGGFG
jgi:hypothetical protein